ncbi:MAG: multi-sensor signal transduction histidine kinase [Thermoplasmatales archaeon]|jgi:signal transduction histidine kinase|nr:multi-sensor signal transduction histidine kinase [Thermoplasmatales archaeon]
MKRFQSLKLKIFLPLLGILLVVFLTSSLVVIDRESKSVKESLIETATSYSSLSITSVIQNFVFYNESGFYKFTEVIDNLMKLNDNLLTIQIVNVNGKILFDSEEIQTGKYDERTYGERYLENTTLIQRAGDPTYSLFLDDETRRVDIIQPYFEDWGRHDYSVRYIFSLASLDTMTNEMIVTILLNTGIFIIVSFLLIFFLFNYFISSPIGELTKGVRRMSKGTLGYEVTIKSKDEIGELATAFNTMSNDLKISRDNLEEYSKNLEKLVAARTKELEEKTRRLEQINQDLTIAREELRGLNINLEGRVQERTREVEKLLKQKDEFINQLGHDLKNPLGPLINLIPLLEDKEADPAKKEMLTVLHRNADYMKNLVVKTLELAMLNSPNTRFSIEPLHLSEEIKQIINNKKILFDENHVKITSNIDPSLWIKADRLRFEELLTNIFENSVKYCQEECRITINAQLTNEYVTISITDTGIGMTQEEIGRVFDEFYKADSARHDIQNTGLGMSICRRIVEKHGGTIWVESPGPGKGTTVFFTFPVARAS